MWKNINNNSASNGMSTMRLSILFQAQYVAVNFHPLHRRRSLAEKEYAKNTPTYTAELAFDARATRLKFKHHL